MALYLFNLYRSPNVGVFLKVSEDYLIAPIGIPNTKIQKMESYLKVQAFKASIGGSRLLGPLIAMNSKGIIVSALADDDEINLIKKETKLPIERLPSNYTAVGNLISVNNKGAIVSPLLNKEALKIISNVLDVPIYQKEICGYHQVGSLIVATDVGGIIHPEASDEEIEFVKEALKVDIEPATVNRGVPFVSSGLVANTKGALVGSITSGPELAILSRILKL